ncbi:MAG: hypothetical protein AAGF22_03815 [Pseudomonadota bacterium]
MADESDLNDSEAMVASIVAFLAEGGVRQQDVTIEELGYDQDAERIRLFRDAMLWLLNEGAIASGFKDKRNQFKNRNPFTARQFYLTSKGYDLLSMKFEGSLTLGAAIKQTQSSGTGYANLGTFFGGILGGFTKSVSS